MQLATGVLKSIETRYRSFLSESILCSTYAFGTIKCVDFGTQPYSPPGFHSSNNLFRIDARQSRMHPPDLTTLTWHFQTDVMPLVFVWDNTAVVSAPVWECRRIECRCGLESPCLTESRHAETGQTFYQFPAQTISWHHRYGSSLNLLLWNARTLINWTGI